MASMADRPKRVSVRYRGVPYSLNLVRCRRALVDCQVNGEFDSMEQLADGVGVSRSTASRFFSGRPQSLAVTKRMLDALHLTFADVLTPETEADDAA
jgi:transcriptional regulator with XRE-family HTH domain